MKEKVKVFVEEYNKRRDWDKSILDSIDLRLASDELKMFVDRYVSADKITEEGYDLEMAECYTYEENGTLELQAFNKKTYGTTYFWLTPASSEEEYRKNRVDTISKEINEKLNELIPEVDRLTKSKNELLELKEKISHYDKRG